MRMIAQNQISPGRSEVKPLPSLGFNKQERSQYSIVKAIRNFMLFSEGKKVENGIELEAHGAIEKLTGRSSQGLLIPVTDIQWQKRNVLQTGQPELGGNLVYTELRDSDFIHALRNKALVAKMGAKLYADLVGQVDIPRLTDSTTAFWLAEGESVPESNFTLDLVKLRPKTIGAIVPVTRRLLMQGAPDAEAIVREDILAQLALGFDQAAIVGTGLNNQPMGILNTPGVESVAIGANGGAISWNHIVELETLVGIANADENEPGLGYLTNAAVRGKLKSTQKVTGQAAFLWDSFPNPAFGQPGESRSLSMVNGYPAFSSNQVPSNGTKGTGTNLSSIIFGDFSQLMLASWGVLELLPNPYGAGFEQSIVQIRALHDCDIAVRHPESFAVITDVVTT